MIELLTRLTVWTITLFVHLRRGGTSHAQAMAIARSKDARFDYSVLRRTAVPTEIILALVRSAPGRSYDLLYLIEDGAGFGEALEALMKLPILSRWDYSKLRDAGATCADALNILTHLPTTVWEYRCLREVGATHADALDFLTHTEPTVWNYCRLREVGATHDEAQQVLARFGRVAARDYKDLRAAGATHAEATELIGVRVDGMSCCLVSTTRYARIRRRGVSHDNALKSGAMPSALRSYYDHLVTSWKLTHQQAFEILRLNTWPANFPAAYLLPFYTQLRNCDASHNDVLTLISLAPHCSLTALSKAYTTARGSGASHDEFLAALVAKISPPTYSSLRRGGASHGEAMILACYLAGVDLALTAVRALMFAYRTLARAESLVPADLELLCVLAGDWKSTGSHLAIAVRAVQAKPKAAP